MKNIRFILLGVSLLFSSCVKQPLEPVSNEGRVSFEIKTKDVVEVEAKSDRHENDMNDIYLIVFDGATDKFVECKSATKITDNNYAAPLTPRPSKVKIVAVANVASLVQAKMSSWSSGTTTYDQISADLLTDALSGSGGALVSMPEVPPMFSELMLDKIEKAMNITSPIVMERATAKITISVTAADFVLFGANLYNAPTKGYVIANQTKTKQLAIDRANYAGSDGNGGYGSDYMISTTTLTDPLYCYEAPVHTDAAKHPYVIIKSNKGYYRINLIDKDGLQIGLQRNYYYKIKIAKVVSDGASTADEAVNNPPLNADIVVDDPDSHEIITDGVDYLGLTNSEYIIYDSYALNEFNSDGDANGSGSDYESINGYDAATLTYKSRSAGEVICTEFTTESGVGTLRFQNAPKGVWDNKLTIEEMLGWNVLTDKLTLPASSDAAVSKKIIINIPHDFLSAKLKVKVGALEREIIIKRHEIISYMGDVLDMGTGFSTAYIEFEESIMADSYSSYENPPYHYPVPNILRYAGADLIGFSTSEVGSGSKKLELSPSDKLYVNVTPLGGDQNMMYGNYPMHKMRASEFYMTRDVNQSRVRVHLIQEPFLDGARDAQAVGAPSANYCAAFWKNNEAGERIIRVPTRRNQLYWTARVIYGEEFIRLTYTDARTSPLGVPTTGVPEDYRPDNTWKTYLQNPPTKGQVEYPKFRIGLTGENPNPAKPRYGLVAFMVPYAYGSGGVGQTFLIFVRQGEEPDYVFAPSDTYNGSPRGFAQAFSPYNLTVPDPANHPGGPNFTDHKSMNGRAVFAEYPTQQGYLYQWGNDIAIHPDKPAVDDIIGYTYDYDAPYKEICPQGYALARTDDANLAYYHSFVDPAMIRSNRGLCADGYYDRVQHGTQSPSYPVGSGPEKGTAGYVYYNTKTLASIFMPYISNRIDGKSSGSSSTTVVSWANIEGQTGDKQGMLSTGGTNVSDRKGALSVRPVKITTP